MWNYVVSEGCVRSCSIGTYVYQQPCESVLWVRGGCLFVFHQFVCVSTVMWVYVVSEGSVRLSLTCYMNHRWIWARLLLQMKQWQLR